MELTDNLNIIDLKPLISPMALRKEIPVTRDIARVVIEGRGAIQKIISRQDPRLMVIVGPCSLHDVDATLEYSRRLRDLQERVNAHALLIMRAYFEKPRTTLGWKGMIYDPYLDSSDDIEEGFRRSRGLLREITALGLPAATEILDPIVPQYLSDLISWAAIGARTAESQIHRQMASGLSMPIGFKNSTDGNLTVAIEAIRASSKPHSFIGISREGRAAIATTRGNSFSHLVLRGGTHGPNYQSEYVAFAEELLRKNGIGSGILVDCSHANSHKDPRRQRDVFLDVLAQRRAGNRSIIGMMLESFLEEGSQPIPTPPTGLKYGVSITDKCVGWDETEELIKEIMKYEL